MGGCSARALGGSGRPVARLVPISAELRGLGTRAGRMWMAEDFDAPLAEDFLVHGAR